MGIFSSQEETNAATAEASAPVYSGTPQRKAVLLGHILATKTDSSTVTDNDMAVPAPGELDPKLGHKEHGRTICIHSLAVLPEYQHRGLGKTLVKAYLQRMEGQGVADRVALIAHDHLTPFYEQFGFVNKGKSAAQFGGGGWYDMVRELEPGRTSVDA
jgi:predicted N-acetyltransferase YhbS